MICVNENMRLIIIILVLFPSAYVSGGTKTIPEAAYDDQNLTKRPDLGHSHEVTLDGTPCVFPFNFGGNEHDKCIRVRLGKSWFPMCSITKSAATKYDLRTCYNSKVSCSSPAELVAGGQEGWKQEFGTVSDKYKNFEHCSWTVRAPTGKRVRLHFTRFSVEFARGCKYDSLDVFDGSTADAQRIQRNCGGSGRLPEDAISTGNALHLSFTTDESYELTGFRIRYHVVSCRPLTELTGSSGSVGTTPSSYGNYESCSWKIQVSTGKFVKLTFKRFQLEYGDCSCPYDNVAVFDGQDSTATEIGTYCGATMPNSIVSSGNTMFIRFRSDISVTQDGFSADFLEVDDAIKEGDSDLCQNGGNCVEDKPNGYHCECLDGYQGETCAIRGYDCGAHSPCTAEKLAKRKFYFPHPNPKKFVQCSAHGRCWVMPCGPGTKFNERLQTCAW